ncbi:helix-turn-helix domain-containing protein [Yoonia sp. BS5-3]|uniref:Helix-turn-helix domain-containing protein n=1 Tax=Yoonia phaeophyticola TaxID=3137369 RepID=A0ABZ2V638_9RHOB
MIYRRWEYIVASDEVVTILPGGCRDIIWAAEGGLQTQIRLTQWDDQPRQKRLKAGTTLVGYRLCPGVVLDSAHWADATVDPGILGDMINSAADDYGMAEVIDALTQAQATVAQVAKQGGVTVRTLQRRFRQLSLPNPEYWRLLGRARRAVQALPAGAPLAEIAHDSGYSDQAHMTRDFLRWFGQSPARLRRDHGLIAQVSQPGLGNWRPGTG